MNTQNHIEEQREQRFQDKFKSLVLAHGRLLDSGYMNRQSYQFEGWGVSYDYDGDEHMKQCSYVTTPYTSDVEVITVSSYDDTDADERSREVLEVAGVNCDCGVIANRTIRWEASMKAIVQAMTSM